MINMKKFHERKKMLGLAVSVSAALLGNSLVVGNAMESAQVDQIESLNDNEVVEGGEGSDVLEASMVQGRAALIQYTVNTDSLNVRSGPSTSYSILGGLKRGTVIEVQSITSGWAKFNYNGKTAYCNATYLQKKATTSMKVNTDSLNVRSGPSTSYSILGGLKRGTVIEVQSITSGWAKFNYNGKTAYCNATYLDTVTSTSGSTGGSTGGNASGSASMSNNTATTTESVYLRSSASWGASKGIIISKGSVVEVVSKGSDWTQVKYNGQTGYVSNDHLSFSVSGSTGGNASGSTSTSNNTATTTESVYLRSSASWGASKGIIISKGSVVEVVSKGSDWTQVKYNGQTGYVSNDHLSFSVSGSTGGNASGSTTLKKYEVTTESLNVRSGPSTSYGIVGSVKLGEIVEVYSISSGWAEIKHGTGKAYVSASYIKEYNGSSDQAAEKKVVFIDAGHGGTDPGAIGKTYGTLEKEAVLDVSKKVIKALEGKGYVVKYSRNTDTYVTLADRSSKANSANASIFVSMHFNSATSTSATGIETLYKVDGRTSNVLADKVQKELISASGLRDRGLKQRSDLAVLNGTKMPAILIEGGFLSNSSDENSIRNDAFRTKLANAIVKGIEAYFSVSK